jgi:hypothetical protein
VRVQRLYPIKIHVHEYEILSGRNNVVCPSLQTLCISNIDVYSTHAPASTSVLLRHNSSSKLPKSQNREYVAVVGIVKVQGGVKASNMFLVSKSKHKSTNLCVVQVMCSSSSND